MGQLAKWAVWFGFHLADPLPGPGLSFLMYLHITDEPGINSGTTFSFFNFEHYGQVKAFLMKYRHVRLFVYILFMLYSCWMYFGAASPRPAAAAPGRAAGVARVGSGSSGHGRRRPTKVISDLV